MQSGAAPTTRAKWAPFIALFPAQREANLQIRLREFLRVSLAAGIFYET